MIDVAQEFGYRISTFHHAVESYKIADLLAEEGICSAMWADWWGFKLEAFDGDSAEHRAGGCGRRLRHRPLRFSHGYPAAESGGRQGNGRGQRQGMIVEEARAIGWITLNPARALEIDGKPAPSRWARRLTWCSGTVTPSASTAGRSGLYRRLSLLRQVGPATQTGDRFRAGPDGREVRDDPRFHLHAPAPPPGLALCLPRSRRPSGPRKPSRHYRCQRSHPDRSGVIDNALCW